MVSVLGRAQRVLRRGVVPAVAALAIAAPAAHAAKEDLWRPAPAAAVQSDLRPERYRAYELDRPSMEAALHSTRLELELPAPDGGFQRFVVREAPVMEPGLARRHPEIATYRGQGIDEPAASVRLDLGPLGFHASVRGPEGSWYIDPAGDLYLAHYGRDLPSGPFVEDEDTSHQEPIAGPGPTTGPERRVYRLALASDPEFARRAGGPANVTAAKVTLVNRLNQIFEDETSISLRLIDGNDRLNLDTDAAMTGPNGPCGEGPCYTEEQVPCNSSTLSRNGIVLNRIVGAESFDIGHLVLGTAGIGIAGVGSVGGRGKASGCSSSPAPGSGDDPLSMVAHEMGHQFGAHHSFNGALGQCEGNRSAATSVEPGSGSTVMAYAGACGPDDLQLARDAQWSQRSFEEIVRFVTTSPDAGGFRVERTGNAAPAVTAPDGFTIPLRTPFALTGSASDADGDPVTYMWEQNDRGADLIRGEPSGIALRSNVKPNGPLFRVPSAPEPDPTRVLPDMAKVLANRTNAGTGTCFPQDVQCFSEFLPTADYVGVDGVNANPPTLHFRLTARDGRGGVSSADTAVALAAGTGPFLVTAPNAETRFPAGSTQTVTWDVARTDRAPIGASDVKISLSTDGGATFDRVLAAGTPNDGSARVTLPDVDNARARIKVEAVGNVFFDVSDADFAIGTALSPPVVANVDDVKLQHSDSPGAGGAPISATDADSPGSALTATATGLPAGISLVVDSTASGARTWRLAGAVEGAPGVYHATVTVTDDTGAQRSTSFDITVRPEDAQVTYVGDELATAGASVLLRVTVRDDPDGSRGDVRNATVTFTARSGTLCAAVPVVPLGGDGTIGSAHCSAQLGPDRHTLAIAVHGSHAGSARANVEVREPDDTRVSAAAFQRVGTSAGVYRGDPGSLLGVALHARPSLDGAAAVHIRSRGRSIWVTSVDIQSAGIAAGVADVRARARVTDATGVLVRDATLRLTATDQGFGDDTLSVTLWDGDRLLFASEWNGVETIERPLHFGGVLVSEP